MTAYAAFLRGINVGGHKIIPMTELTAVFVSLRFKNVRTVLASGNVLFEVPGGSAPDLTRKIAGKLKESFGFDIGVIIRTMAELQRLSASQPFKGIPVTPQTRLYVTFLSEAPRDNFQVPYKSAGGNFRILRASRREVYSVVTLVPDSRSVDMMLVLEKQFGRKITTRNWKTILRVLSAHQSTTRDSLPKTTPRERKG